MVSKDPYDFERFMERVFGTRIAARNLASTTTDPETRKLLLAAADFDDLADEIQRTIDEGP